MPYLEREEMRKECEREIAVWVARYHGDPREGRFSRIELLGLADAALERQRRFEVEQLRDTPAGQAQARALERDGP